MASANQSTQRSVSPNAVPALPLLYRSPTVLRFEEHNQKGVKPAGDYRFAAGVNAVPLAMSEFMPAVRNFPIVFAEGELPAPVALLGIRQGENLYVGKDGSWQQDAYIPAYLRRYPFILTETADKSTRVLCVDKASDRFVDVNDNDEWRLFNTDGSATTVARKMLELSEAWHQEQLLGAEFVKALKAADLLVPQGMTFSFPEGRFNLGGYRVVDRDRMRGLPANTLKEWNEKGWLDALALHLASLQNWQLLIQRVGTANKKEVA